MSALQTSTLPARKPHDLAGDPEWMHRSNLATIKAGEFKLGTDTVEVVLLEIDSINERGSKESYPMFFDTLWVAMARRSTTKEVLAAYEFYAGPFDALDLTKLGTRLVGKAIETDCNHLRQGIAVSLVETLILNGVPIRPSGECTPAGGALLAKISARGRVTLPGVADAVAEKWPL